VAERRRQFAGLGQEPIIRSHRHDLGAMWGKYYRFTGAIELWWLLTEIQCLDGVARFRPLRKGVRRDMTPIVRCNQPPFSDSQGTNSTYLRSLLFSLTERST